MRRRPFALRTPISRPSVAAGIVSEYNFCLPFPLRSGYLAQVVIPRDMTEEEGKRLCRFIMCFARKEYVQAILGAVIPEIEGEVQQAIEAAKAEGMISCD